MNVDPCGPIVVQCLTWLYDSGLGPQVGQVHISFPAVYNGVWIFAGSVSRGPVCHGHLQKAKHFPLTSWRRLTIIFCHNDPHFLKQHLRVVNFFS